MSTEVLLTAREILQKKKYERIVNSYTRLRGSQPATVSDNRIFIEIAKEEEMSSNQIRNIVRKMNYGKEA